MNAGEGSLCPPPGDLSDQGIRPSSLVSPALAGVFFTIRAIWEAPTRERRTINKDTDKYTHRRPGSAKSEEAEQSKAKDLGDHGGRGEGVLPYMDRVVGKGHIDEVTFNLTWDVGKLMEHLMEEHPGRGNIQYQSRERSTPGLFEECRDQEGELRERGRERSWKARRWRRVSVYVGPKCHEELWIFF